MELRPMAESPTIIYDANIGSSQRSTIPAPISVWYSLHHLCSMAAGAFIFFTGGMAMAQGLGWTEYRVTGYSGHFQYSWFVAVIIGIVLSLPAIRIMPKKFIMGISSLLILAGGIVFTCSPHNLDALVAGRYLNGIAVGLATTPYLTVISDISRFGARGACLGIEQLSLTLGMALQIIITTRWDVRSLLTTNSLHGILDIILAILAGISLWRFVESPVDYLRMGDEASALGALARLQRPPRVNSATNISLVEHNTYLNEHCDLGICSSIGPMLKMIFFRSMMLAFTFSLPLSEMLKMSKSTILSKTSNPSAYLLNIPIVVAAMRILGAFLALLATDRLGRKLPALISALAAGAFMISIAVICRNYDNLDSAHAMSCVSSFCLMVQFCAGMFAPLTSAYVAEAFPLKTKPYCIALCAILEQVIQIIVLCLADPIGNDGTLMAEGIMIVVTTIYFGITMPETKQTSLREAQKRFRNLLNWKAI
uniref:Major facilitator superfamily (MFS) profile domain-containing protein n=1 Tax=Stomoxys calcitrans TaxID=35570 RepID=A0A1I8PFG2_STOCA